MTIELRCSRDLALKLGAVIPETIKQHREFRDAQVVGGVRYLIVRDRETGWPMFWQWQLTKDDIVSSTRSS